MRLVKTGNPIAALRQHAITQMALVDISSISLTLGEVELNIVKKVPGKIKITRVKSRNSNEQ